MKKILIALLFFGSLSYGQTKGISYQALIINPIEQELPGFNNNQAPLANKNICLKFSLIDELNSLEYEEIFTTTTDDVGMVNLIIGTEDRTGGYASSFEDITWSSLPKNLKVDLSVSDGCSNFIEISNAPFTAVPYALFALNTENTPLVLDNEAEIILLKSLLATTQLGAGLNTDGTYSPNASSNFITGATSLNNADTILDGQVKNNTDAITDNTTSIVTNTSDIATNLTAITDNTASIGTNTTGIADNTTAINERVKIVDIVDDLTTGGTTVPLSAEQGKVLKGLVDSSVNITVEDNLTSTSTSNALSANQGRELKALLDSNASNITGAVMTTGDQTIAGAKTFSSTIVGDINGNAATATTTTGNAATATALETARTIGGVSFDGTANIDLPGVNTAGNQDTSGNAATATTTTGNAATATLASTVTVNTPSSDTNAASPGGISFSATASIGKGSRLYEITNGDSQTFNAGIDILSSSVVTITFTSHAQYNGFTALEIQPVITLNATNNTFTVTCYANGNAVTPDSNFLFNFIVIK